MILNGLPPIDIRSGGFTEIDPTVPGWAKGDEPPEYTAQDVGAAAVSMKTASLTVAGWNGGTQTVAVQGAKASGQAVIVSPATAAASVLWGAAGLFCSAQGANTLTFTCEEQPAGSIAVNIVLIDNAV